MAKSALKEAGLKEYFLMELDEVDDGAAIQDALQKVTGARTVGFYFGLAACKILYFSFTYRLTWLKEVNNLDISNFRA